MIIILYKMREQTNDIKKLREKHKEDKRFERYIFFQTRTITKHLYPSLHN